MIFGTCLECGGPTERVKNAEPDYEFNEARNLLLHSLFEQYYERHCADRGVPVDGPLDDSESSELLDSLDRP
jgi:hypothetical protein